MTTTRIGLFPQGWWKGACDALEIDVVDLPTQSMSEASPYSANIGSRLANGQTLAPLLRDDNSSFMLDNGGTGLAFLRNLEAQTDLQMLHETAGRLLCSHFVDPLTTAFQGIGWEAAWQCLQSESWLKAVWDRAQVIELQRFGVPGVVHLPMAAPNRAYDTSPIDPAKQLQQASFVGAQNTSYFSSNASVATGSLFAGTLATALRSGSPQSTFYEAYHDWYGLGLPVAQEDDQATRLQKTIAYFNAKLFFNASLCLQNRDRYVIFLKRKMGDTFHLIGRGWDTAYGLSAQAPFPSADAYFEHFRSSAVNLNFVNGNAETGLNMRHFEITAAGGFMLCQDQPELAELFDVGRECAVFRDEVELAQKIDYYLAHPDERMEIARAGQARTLSQHMFSHRLEKILQWTGLKKLPVEYSTGNLWETCRAILPEADVVLDCGANVGQTAESLRNLYPSSEIHSFEPVREAFDSLAEKCKSIKVNPIKKAVGDKNGKAVINLTHSSEAHSLLGFEAGNPCAQWTRITGQEEIDVCTLDSWCKDNDISPKRVDLIKLDVQGSELQALHGAKELLRSARLVTLEVSFVPMYKDSPLLNEIDGFMTQNGYERAAIFPSDQPHNWGDALYAKK